MSPLVLLNFFDRLVRKLILKPKVNDEEDDDFSILVMGSHELSDNAGADFVLDNKLDHVMIALNRPKTLEAYEDLRRWRRHSVSLHVTG